MKKAIMVAGLMVLGATAWGQAGQADCAKIEAGLKEIQSAATGSTGLLWAMAMFEAGVKPAGMKVVAAKLDNALALVARAAVGQEEYFGYITDIVKAKKAVLTAAGCADPGGKTASASLSRADGRCSKEEAKRPHVGMLLARAHKCIGGFKLSGETDTVEGVEQAWEHENGYILVVNGVIIDWGKY